MTGLTEHRAGVQRIPHVLRVGHWESRVGAKHRQGTQTSVCICADRWHECASTHGHVGRTELSQFCSLSLPPWIQCLYTFNISPDDQTAASSVLSAEPRLKQKRRRAKAYGF